MNEIKNILGNEIYDSIIILIGALVGITYLNNVYPPAKIPFLLLYYFLWIRYQWRIKKVKNKRKSKIDELLDMCEKPKGRWEQ